jgi:exodeoxyribonuclease V beta subunit
MEYPDFEITESPPARLLIEASAGTGKTHALTGLAVHLLGRGEVGVDELLVVTFTRLATAELRDRIRATIEGVRETLDDSAPDPGLAPIVESLRSWDVSTARANLTDALARYDALTVTTIHGFAQRALASFGALAGENTDFTVLTDSSEMLIDAANDEYASLSHRYSTVPITGGSDDDDSDIPPPLRALPKSVGRVVATAKSIDDALDLLLLPEVDLAPAAIESLVASGEVDEPTACALVARRSVEIAAARRRGGGFRSYGELLTGLRGALDGPVGTALQKRLGDQFRVALIDEFQDTDQVQWSIFDRCFGRGDGRLILVGDPKQAIYAFRGANIHTYSSAASQSGMARRRLGTNWRSDGPVLRGLETLLTGAEFGSGIEFTPVGPAPAHEESRLRLGDGQPIIPVELAFADKESLELETRSKTVGAGIADQVIDRYLVEHLIDLLDHGMIENGDGSARRVDPSDIAILVRSHVVGATVAAALEQAGIPAVVHGEGDVRASAAPGWSSSPKPSVAATAWRYLLEAVADPADARRARAAAVGVFGPLRSPVDLAAVDEETIAAFQRQLVDWAEELRRSGPAAFTGRIWAESPVVTRVLGSAGGDRLMTDLEHLGELFAVEFGTAPVSPDRLIGLLDPPSGSQDDGGDRIGQRRIPTGAPSVTIMTVHKAKGLEFPIVGCIGMHKLDGCKADRSYDQTSGRQVVDLAKGADFVQGARNEQRDESLRLLYVALTRAAHHVFTCWIHEQNSPYAPLTRVLFARDADGSIDLDFYRADKITPPTGEAARGQLEALAARSDGTLGIRILDADDLAGAMPRWQPGQTATSDTDAAKTGASEVSVATLSKRPDRYPSRWSFTAITARRDHQTFPDDAPTESGADEGPDAVASDGILGDVEETAARASETPVSPLAWLPAGTAFGTLVHAVLEDVDFISDDLVGDLRRTLVAEQAVRNLPLRPAGPAGSVDGTGEELLVDGLAEAIEAPLGALWGGRRLRDVRLADRLSECSFDLRLDPADDRALTARTIGEVALAHLPSDDPYRPWAEGLAEGRFTVDLSGHLTGSIDLVARIYEADDDTPRFVVSDYKSNRLHPAGQRPGPHDYGPEALVKAMVAHDYPLQALLYSVALHRYLRWRLPDYDPAVHLGGVTYLFVRGMLPVVPAGSEEQPPGVASWRVPPGLIAELDARFAGRSA